MLPAKLQLAYKKIISSFKTYKLKHDRYKHPASVYTNDDEFTKEACREEASLCDAAISSTVHTRLPITVNQQRNNNKTHIYKLSYSDGSICSVSLYSPEPHHNIGRMTTVYVKKLNALNNQTLMLVY